MEKNDWSNGYVTDIAYTYGYYAELNPLRAKLPLIYAGIEPPKDSNSHCELGFGQGISINIHAAASNSVWYGNDFNPEQVSFAQSLTPKTDINIKLSDDSFEEYLNRTDLPQFDTISLHGIWSWISDDNRKYIVEFIKKKLKVGGLVYISYNTLPGWLNFQPIQFLMNRIETSSKDEALSKKIKQSIIFTNEIIEKSAIFQKSNPSTLLKTKELLEKNTSYIAHEYFNKDWRPMYFSEMHDALENAKLKFSCSATYLDHVENINLTTDQQVKLSEINQVTSRETIRDFFVNQQFRRDYWIKGPQYLTINQRDEMLKEFCLISIVGKNNTKLKIRGMLGEADLNPTIYKPILDLMSDCKIRSLQNIHEEIGHKGISFAHVAQAALVLIASGYMDGVQEDKIQKIVIEQCRVLNKKLIELAEKKESNTFLASPITGGGIFVNRIQQLFIKKIQEGSSESTDLVEFVRKILEKNQQSIIKNGVNLTSKSEIENELKEQVSDFINNRLYILKALKIID